MYDELAASNVVLATSPRCIKYRDHMMTYTAAYQLHFDLALPGNGNPSEALPGPLAS